MRRNLSLSVVDQALVSAFNFGLNLYLIKLWSPAAFGTYALIAAAAIFVLMAQNAIINTPLAVHLPIATDDIERSRLHRVFTAANLLFALLAMLLSGVTLALLLDNSQSSLILSAAIYITSQVLREYIRNVLAVDGKLGALLLVDLLFVSAAGGTLAYLHWTAEPQWQTVSILLLLLSGCSFITILWHLAPKQMLSLGNLSSEMRQVFGKQLHEIRWSLLGVITTDVQNRGYIFVAAAVFGPTVVAHLQAGRIFFGPFNLLTSAWARVARPQLARLMGQSNAAGFSKLLWQAVFSFILLNILFLTFLWFAWPHLTKFVFGDKYIGMGAIIVAWGIANFAFQVRSTMGIGVQAMRMFRELTLATIYGSVASVFFIVVAVAMHEPYWLIASVIGGECVAIVLVVRILRRHLNVEGKAGN